MMYDLSYVLDRFEEGLNCLKYITCYIVLLLLIKFTHFYQTLDEYEYDVVSVVGRNIGT